MKMNILGITLIVTLISGLSCNRNNYFNNDVIKDFSKDDYKYLSEYSGLNLFVIVDSNQIGEITLSQLKLLYKLDYSKEFKSIEHFLDDALNQRKMFSRNTIENRNGLIFKINDSVKAEYEKYGISCLLSKYCESNETSYFIKNKALSKSELFSIMYFFSINSYKVGCDDYIGTYIVTPYRIDQK